MPSTKSAFRNLRPSPGARRDIVDVDVPCTTSFCLPARNQRSLERVRDSLRGLSPSELRRGILAAFSYTANRFVVYRHT
jgi:hypothetical protein